MGLRDTMKIEVHCSMVSLATALFFLFNPWNLLNLSFLIRGGYRGGGGTFAHPEISRHSEENKNVLCILMFLILFLEFFVPIFRIASQ